MLAHGFAHEITNAIDHRSVGLQAQAPDPLAPGPKEHLVQIRVNSVSGRRLS